MNKLVIILVVLTTTMVLGTISSPANNASAAHGHRHHLHLTDTQKENSTAFDTNGNPCIFGPAHDQCGGQLKTGNINQDCEDKGGNIGEVCDLKN